MRLARAYGVPLIDYERPGDGVLLAVGSGLMLAAMDAMERIRWCVDIGGGRPFDGLASWLEASDRFYSAVIVCAWYSVSDPANLRRALRQLNPDKVFAYANVPLDWGYRAPTFQVLVGAVNARLTVGLAG